MDEEKRKNLRKNVGRVLKNVKRVRGNVDSMAKELRYYNKKFKSVFG